MKKSAYKKLIGHYKTQAAIAAAGGVSRATVTNWKQQINGASAKAAIKLSRDSGIPAEQICEALK